ESRSKNCVMRLALLTIWAAFLVRAGYWLWSASLAVGIAPGDAFQKVIWLEPLAMNSRKAFACPRSAFSVGDFLVTMKTSIGASSAFSASYWAPMSGNG